MRDGKKRGWYGGVEPRQKITRKTHNGFYVYNGIDRVDNAIGYMPSNSIPCCKICNRAKREMSYLDFKEWIKSLILNNKEAF